MLNVSVLEGEQVTVEDTGGQEPFILANESVLMTGLVLRSWSNQISISLRSEKHRNSAYLLLHYQGEQKLYITSFGAISFKHVTLNMTTAYC